MMRNSTTVLGVLALGLGCGLPAAGAGPALAREDARAMVLAAAAETPPRATWAPRAPRAPARRAAEAPEPPEPPEAPSLVTPRGWFGFGFQCDECSAQAVASGDSGAVWEFGTHPKVYSVDLGSPAARAGLRRGDVITGIDGISILSPDGGRRFGAIRPGQTVKWTVIRGDRPQVIVARAAERPDRPERPERLALLDLHRELNRLNELSDSDQLRKELSVLKREMERVRVQDIERVRVRTPSPRRLRYAGVVGGTEVEVRGPGSVIVSEAEDKGELVINLGESVVVIRVPDRERRRPGETPK